MPSLWHVSPKHTTNELLCKGTILKRWYTITHQLLTNIFNAFAVYLCSNISNYNPKVSVYDGSTMRHVERNPLHFHLLL